MSYSNCNNLPGIIAVMWMKAESLSKHMVEKYVAGLPVALGVQGNMMELVETGTATSLQTAENNGLVGKATLEFKTLSPIPSDEDIAWAAKDADGQWWLMGSRERNFPVVEVSTSAGTPGGDPAVSTVKITHQAKIALIPVSL